MAGDPQREREGVTMRAMQIVEWGKPREGREYPNPDPQKRVLLRVRAGGVCHSDVQVDNASSR